MLGGEGGIRTRVRLSPKHAFQACDLNHSSTSPDEPDGSLCLFPFPLFSELWGGRWDSNPRRLESQSRTLPTELRPPLTLRLATHRQTRTRKPGGLPEKRSGDSIGFVRVSQSEICAQINFAIEILLGRWALIFGVLVRELMARSFVYKSVQVSVCRATLQTTQHATLHE